jgi:hypothetical protein
LEQGTSKKATSSSAKMVVWVLGAVLIALGGYIVRTVLDGFADGPTLGSDVPTSAPPFSAGALDDTETTVQRRHSRHGQPLSPDEAASNAPPRAHPQARAKTSHQLAGDSSATSAKGASLHDLVAPLPSSDCTTFRAKADAAYRAGQFQDAVEALIACTEADSESATPYWDVGVMLSQLKDFTNALSWMAEASIWFSLLSLRYTRLVNWTAGVAAV